MKILLREQVRLFFEAFAIFICLRKTVLKIGTRLALFQSDGIQSQDTDLESVFYETCNHYSPKHLKQELNKDDTHFIENKYYGNSKGLL